MMAADLLIGLLAVALLVLPGWLVAKSARVPQPLLAGFVGGAVAMHALVLVLDTVHVRLDLVHVGVAWLVLIAACGWWTRRKRTWDAPSAPAAFSLRENWPLLLPLVPASAVAGWRAIAQPLSGVDTIFRWNWLAEQLLARGTLDFYPPTSAAAYEIYSWPDGIAPVVSVLYFWSYAVAGAARPLLTAPVVLLQFGLVLGAAYALARRLFSERAAVFAVAIAACSPVLVWASVMGQETGLTALSLAAMLLWLPASRAEESTGAMIAAGLAAALGALAREYGLLWPALGLGIGRARRLSRRSLFLFAATAAVGALPWYLRNWVLTGNPLFNLSVGGWFATNTVHQWLMESYAQEFGLRHLPPESARLILTNCIAALVGGVAGAFFAGRQVRVLVVASFVVVALWLASLAYTAAGFIHAFRVLSPAFLLAAVMGGAACARAVPARAHRGGVAIALGLLAVDAALRALALPANVYRVPPAEWLRVGRTVADYHARPLYRELARITAGHRVLVLGPNAVLAAQGARTLPPWSPEVSYLFDAKLAANEVARRLATADIRFVLLTKGPANERFLRRSPFLRPPGGTMKLLWADEDLVLFQVESPVPEARR
jgi:4-amino-4-deoxy-L-arabinose transferase-like glycosyltransferase